MNLNNLSSLSNVINQVKNVINTSGHGRFPRETMLALKQKVAALEEQFVKDVLDNSSEPTRKDVHNRIQEAKKELAGELNKVEKAAKNVKMNNGLTTVAATEEELPVTTEAVNDLPVKNLPVKLPVKKESKTLDTDPALSSRLAEEKKKLIAKGKRKVAQ